ncbi:hypothetical protein DFH08DRAFT_111584 [Mycena albidolilacea]|uniref:Uncharacterized protein n=1 Tax=Mycena albidolilacea TaxID=1033008 RepID=A0AAD7ET39_9AGAR|nr:hypothetical protein DFH08DRAFT_111584 [Mycena albidolilacea]
MLWKLAINLGISVDCLLTTMTSPFLALPAELLLIILGELCDIHYFHSRADPPYLHIRSNTCRSINGLRAISMVNQRLRNVSLCILFEISRCPSSEKFEQLSAKCTTDSQFARFIVQLDVVDVDTRQLLPELLPFLTSLVRLDLNADALDAHLLTIANAHPTLLTVAIPVALLSHLETLMNIPDLPFSKILVSKTIDSNTIVNGHKHSPNFGIFPTMVQRGASFSRLTLRDKFITDATGARSLTLPGLKHLDLIFFSKSRTTLFVQSWLLPFARRHTHLTMIKFTHSGTGRGWERLHYTSGVPFAPEFLAAVSADGISGVHLCLFSIARPGASWSSLKDWDVMHLDLEVTNPASGISALKLASVFAPHLSSLHVVLPVKRWNTLPCHIDEFVEPFASVPFLRILSLSNGYANLQADEPSPWMTTLGSTENTYGTAAWVTALHAMQWYMTRVAQSATGLERIHVTEQGGGRVRRSGDPTILKASFMVVTSRNGARELEILGSPKGGQSLAIEGVEESVEETFPVRQR